MVSVEAGAMVSLDTGAIISEDEGAITSEDDGAMTSEDDDGTITSEEDETTSTGVVVGVPRLKIQIRPMMTITATMMMIQVLRFMGKTLCLR